MWLDNGSYQGNTIDENEITMHPVSMKVNHIKNNQKSNIEEVEVAPTLFTI